MTPALRSIALVATLCTLPGAAFAQDGIFDLFQKYGAIEEEAQPVSPEPPDAMTSYFGNKRASLPEHPGDVKNIAGAWTITTDRQSSYCSLNGHAQITLTPSGGYTCDLVMRDYCADQWDGIIRQSCTCLLYTSPSPRDA